MQDLKESLYTNPHSGHSAWGSDVSATECEAEARALTLAMCNAPAEVYECIFTSGATGAPRTVWHAQNALHCCKECPPVGCSCSILALIACFSKDICILVSVYTHLVMLQGRPELQSLAAARQLRAVFYRQCLLSLSLPTIKRVSFQSFNTYNIGESLLTQAR